MQTPGYKELTRRISSLSARLSATEQELSQYDASLEECLKALEDSLEAHKAEAAAGAEQEALAKQDTQEVLFGEESGDTPTVRIQEAKTENDGAQTPQRDGVDDDDNALSVPVGESALRPERKSQTDNPSFNSHPRTRPVVAILDDYGRRFGAEAVAPPAIDPLVKRSQTSEMLRQMPHADAHKRSRAVNAIADCYSGAHGEDAIAPPATLASRTRNEAQRPASRKASTINSSDPIQVPGMRSSITTVTSSIDATTVASTTERPAAGATRRGQSTVSPILAYDTRITACISKMKEERERRMRNAKLNLTMSADVLASMLGGTGGNFAKQARNSVLAGSEPVVITDLAFLTKPTDANSSSQSTAGDTDDGVKCKATCDDESSGTCIGSTEQLLLENAGDDDAKEKRLADDIAKSRASLWNPKRTVNRGTLLLTQSDLTNFYNTHTLQKEAADTTNEERAQQGDRFSTPKRKSALQKLQEQLEELEIGSNNGDNTRRASDPASSVGGPLLDTGDRVEHARASVGGSDVAMRSSRASRIPISSWQMLQEDSFMVENLKQSRQDEIREFGYTADMLDKRLRLSDCEALQLIGPSRRDDTIAVSIVNDLKEVDALGGIALRSLARIPADRSASADPALTARSNEDRRALIRQIAKEDREERELQSAQVKKPVAALDVGAAKEQIEKEKAEAFGLNALEEVTNAELRLLHANRKLTERLQHAERKNQSLEALVNRLQGSSSDSASSAASATSRLHEPMRSTSPIRSSAAARETTAIGSPDPETPVLLTTRSPPVCSARAHSTHLPRLHDGLKESTSAAVGQRSHLVAMKMRAPRNRSSSNSGLSSQTRLSSRAVIAW